MFPGICQALGHEASSGLAVQTRLNGSRSCLGGDFCGERVLDGSSYFPLRIRCGLRQITLATCCLAFHPCHFQQVLSTGTTWQSGCSTVTVSSVTVAVIRRLSIK